MAVLLRIVSNPLGNVLQKQLTVKGNHPLLVNFLTYLLLSVLCAYILLSTNWMLLAKEFWIYGMAGGFAGALGNGFLVKALQKGDLSVLGPVNSYKSVVGMFVAVFLLGELPNIWGLLGVALIIYGSYFVLDTTEDRFSWTLLKKKEIQFRILALLFTAVEAVLIKKVITTSTVTIAFVSWCCFGALFSLLLLFVYRLPFAKEFKKIKAHDLNYYLLLIVCIGTMQLTTNYVFNRMPVGYALSLFQLSIILSVLFGYRLFNEQNIRKKLIGSAIMIVGSVVIILLK
ncbi:MAG: EamA family transporter [Lacibacter sp.]